MAGVDTEFSGEARAATGIKIGYLPQEPQLDPAKDVRGNVEDGVREALDALERLNQIYAEYAEPDADFDKLAAEQGKMEDIIQAWDAHNLNTQLEKAADALRLPPWDADVSKLSGVKNAVLLCVVCCCPSLTCYFWMNRPTIWMQSLWHGLNAS